MKSDPSFQLPFLNGVYVAIDAIRRCYLIVDGPYCVFTKAEMQYCHNLRCDLLPHLGKTRIVHTASDSHKEEVENTALDRTQQVERVFEQVCSSPDAEIVLTTSFDFHQLLNFPLEAMSQRFAERTHKLVCHVRSRSLGGTWLDGYALVCEALARAIPLQHGRKRPNTAAIVGYLFDRDEPDHQENLEELRRMLDAVGLTTGSIWLSGGGLQALQSVEEASLIISFPYAREAARVLAERLQADLIEVELPLGLTATSEWLETIAQHVGREDQASVFLERELAGAVRDTARHVLRIVSGNTARLLCNDPWLSGGLAALCRDVGLRVMDAAEVSRDDDVDCHELHFAPTLRPPQGHAIDVPMGYPNYVEHPITKAAFLGFSGYRSLVDRIASSILRFEASATMSDRESPTPQVRPTDD